ncbi:MAG: polysaccharide deacetylase family protein [Candidatus Omnitrophica bacterium]|nr:polysaccharide deacetylase family protein [Candidatus Omnitrophota bacterium]
MYHSISKEPQNPLAVQPELFQSQMEILSKAHYRVLPLSEVVKRLIRHEDLKDTLCLTFDDGYLDFKHNAWPVLEQYHFPATIFVVAKKIGGVSDWSRYGQDKPLLAWEDLRFLVQEGAEIGAHSNHHNDLRTLSDENLEEEIGGSKKIIENHLNVEVKSFAYPGGLYGKRELKTVEESGYQCAVRVGGFRGNSYHANPYLLNRDKVLGSDGLDVFQRKVSGAYDLEYAMKALAEKFLKAKT